MEIEMEMEEGVKNPESFKYCFLNYTNRGAPRYMNILRGNREVRKRKRC